MNKKFSIFLAAGLVLASLTGCGSKDTPKEGGEASGDGQKGAITVLSREEGSGTRGAFIELMGIEQKDANGEKVDHTTLEAEVTNSTAVMLTTVEGNDSAIGYISMGSLNDTVKALKIDGAEATAENVKNGSYTVARPFNVVTKETLSPVAQDFMDFILSAEGQAVVEENGYISEGNSGAYAGTKPSGTITVAGSSSVAPVMEKLREAYLTYNPNAKVEVQQSDSTIGVTSVIEGICEIGMASRDLKDSEQAQGVSNTVIARDGIAIIVNKENAIDELKSDQVRAIYMAELTDWSEIQ